MHIFKGEEAKTWQVPESRNFFFVNKTRITIEKPLKPCNYWLLGFCL